MPATVSRRRRPTFSLDHVTHGNLSELALRSGYSPRTIHRWKTNGIPLHSADQLACRLGYHPANIWPDWFHPRTHAPNAQTDHTGPNRGRGDGSDDTR